MTPKVKCQGCGKEVDYGNTPEVAMGAIKCPHCGATIDQTGKVLREKLPSALDKLASHLESIGMIKEAYDLDVVSNTLDRIASESKPTIYIDMDEVLVDWSNAVREKLPEVIEGIPLDSGSEKRKRLVDAINSLGPTFWEDLEWAEGMKALWDELKPYKPILLSALRNHPHAREGKLRWLKKNLPAAHVIFEENKEKYSGRGKILIDDFQSNIDRWEHAGGIGILHTDVSSTRRKLKPYLINT